VVDHDLPGGAQARVRQPHLRARVDRRRQQPALLLTSLGLQALRRARSVLERMPVDERIPLSLAILQGRSLQETAALCRISLATLKRRLQKGRKRFLRLAALDPILRDFCPEVAP
jgi:RNA polymerase sigma-70 factor (ECF subfamily)